MPLLIFDLDGTLIDSKLDIAYSVNAMLAYMQRPPITHERVGEFIGNGAPVLMRRALGREAGEEEVAKALDFFIRYYAEHCLDHTALYPNVKDALNALSAREGVRMAVLTNKPVRISSHMIAALGCARHFFRVYGGNSFQRKKPDPIGVETLLAESGAARGDSVMVGDSAVDIRTARNAGIRACGVSYGFRPETFTEEPPDFLIDDLRELAGLVASLRQPA